MRISRRVPVLLVLSTSLAGCGSTLSQGVEVTNVTQTFSEEGASASGQAYWVPIGGDVDSFPVQASEASRGECSPEQTAWLNAHGSKIMFGQEIVVTNHLDGLALLEIRAHADAAGGAPDPGFYVQCGMPIRKEDERVVVPSPGPIQWQQVRLQFSGDQADAVIFSKEYEPANFEPTLGPGESIGIQLVMQGKEPFDGAVELRVTTGDGTVSEIPVPIISGDTAEESISWPGISDGAILVHPESLDSQSDETILYCGIAQEDAKGHPCSPARLVGMIAYSYNDPKIIASYLDRFVENSNCADARADTGAVIDLYSPAAEHMAENLSELLELAVTPLEKLRMTCSPEYVTDLLSEDHHLVNELRWLSEPPEVEGAQPAWADCDASTVTMAARWDSPIPGTMSVCEDYTVILRLDGLAPMTFSNMGGAGAGWSATNDEYEIYGDDDLTTITLVPADGGSIQEFTVTNRWW